MSGLLLVGGEKAAGGYEKEREREREIIGGLFDSFCGQKKEIAPQKVSGST